MGRAGARRRCQLRSLSAPPSDRPPRHSTRALLVVRWWRGGRPGGMRGDGTAPGHRRSDLSLRAGYGHLALNEPVDELQPGCHVAVLAKSSKDHPMLRGRGQPPSHGLTLGMAAILQSKHVLVLVSGAHKRDAMDKFLSCRITPQFPASFLWLHGNI
ncbi:MAG TPA: hypothetical protein EYM34_09645, partial [Alphaproteobacteria bacterium]|nr:hypothetical protein [Alphaproteobacteria bacterium]